MDPVRLLDDEDWRRRMLDLPAFASDTDFEREYRAYLSTITVEQFHGIRVGPNVGEVVITHERPARPGFPGTTVARRVESVDPWMLFDWVPEGDPGQVARLLLRCIDLTLDYDIETLFIERIIKKLPRHEWTLEVAFVREWTQLMIDQEKK
jgi:hypothetical protein